MKRKLIEYGVFEKMKENSLSTSMKELVEAEDHLARALDVDDLKLDSFNESSVIYETAGGTYLRANYSIDKNKVNFDNVEELVIDEETEKNHARSIVENMLEAILDEKDAEAQNLFGKYMGVASKRQKRATPDDSIEEGYARLYGTRGKGGKPKLFHRAGSKDSKKSEAAKKAHRLHPDKYKKGGAKRHRQLSSERARRHSYKSQYGKLKALSGGKQYTGKKHMTEWLTLSNNVFNYLDYRENGQILSESVVKNEDGTTNVSVPTAKARNEGKILKMQFDLMKTDLKVLRESARRLMHDQKFCQGIAEIKRYNNLSDNNELEEAVGSLVTKFPSVLYLTQEELAHVVHNALDNVGVTNYDDQTCTFIAEGILRTAHNAYSERVSRICQAANKGDLKESDDAYMDFQTVARTFFPTLDESTQIEFKVFEDLYNAAVDVRRIALESDNEVVRNEASEFISDLESVLNGKEMPNLDLAADVAGWLEGLAEANIPGSDASWDVVKTPHKTIVGDHPQMAKNAKVPGLPGVYSGDWGDPAPMIGTDSMAWNHGDDARKHSWGNKGGKDVWPELQNPIVPKPFGDYTMKGEKGADKDLDDGLGTWQDSDTVPGLRNPYVPASVTRKQTVDTSEKGKLD